MEQANTILLRDVTLREGLDTPQVHFSVDQRVRIACELEKAGVREAEIVAPSRVEADLHIAQELKRHRTRLKFSGLIYASGIDCGKEIEQSAETLDRFDLLMPASLERPPLGVDEKRRTLRDALKRAARAKGNFGVGIPHAFQSKSEIVLGLVEVAVHEGARRVTVYDTNGGADPLTVRKLIGKMKKRVNVELFFHGHNDLGMATANSLLAALEGADGLDVTVNGLGDRAGNASLEQVAAALLVKGYDTGLMLGGIRELCKKVADESGVEMSKLAPVVGEFVYWHRSPSHLAMPELFEALDPRLFASLRRVSEN